MANTTVYKELGGFLGDKPNHAVLSYDFANDAGAAGSLDLAEAKQPLVIKGAYVHVKTACTSGGSATAAIGSTDDADAILDATSGAVANLTLDAVLFEAVGTAGFFLDTGDKLSFVIGTAALTAGAFDVHIDYDVLSE